MRVSVQQSPSDSKTEMLCLLLTEEDVAKLKKKKPAGGLAGLVHELLVPGEFKGKPGKLAFTYSHGSAKPKRLLLVGLGKHAKADRESVRKAAATATKIAIQSRLPEFAIAMPSLKGSADVAYCITEGASLSHYAFDKYKEKARKKRLGTKYMSILYQGKDTASLNAAVSRAQLVCDNVNMVRDLQTDMVPNKTPEKIASLAQELGRKAGFKVTVFTKPQIEKLGMNLLLAVGSGSQY